MILPGNFLGLRNGTNFAPRAKAMEGPNMNPLASTPNVDKIEQNNKIKNRKRNPK